MVDEVLVTRVTSDALLHVSAQTKFGINSILSLFDNLKYLLPHEKKIQNECQYI